MSDPNPAVRPPLRRWLILTLAMVTGCLFILIMTLLLDKSRAGAMLLDTRTTLFFYPFTIQNLEHILFFIGLGEIFTRWHTAIREQTFLSRHYLPEDDSVVLLSRDLGAIRRKVRSDYDSENGFLPYLIDFCILQFQASRSVDQTVSVLNSSLDLISHRVDLRYTMLRYITWAIPTTGFIGTVVGISDAIYKVNPDAPDLKTITASLGVAFDTTLVALCLSAILVLLLHVIQKQEETCVNQAGQYTLKHLINRLYDEKSS
ncbi:MotA/TolQ/ExbB proton channel family protein [Desulfatirhabdium butyrativorans]|uniref:MotA/TolQ/ExbB proton channel family protein n=1 Tax=Desulfatirhabdium butyrativorans TaxID=340467 RepID=UPI000550903D|nr:MotA/TolQ/ExbB proton channel family protein [Desulfatirhabdium butyrativorans]